MAERLYFEEVMLTKIVQYPTPIDEARRFVEVIETISDSVTELRELEDDRAVPAVTRLADASLGRE